MKLSEQIREDHVLLNFDAKNKDEAIGKLVDCVVNGYDRGAVLSAIMEREKLGSTGVGHGVALPHVRMDAVETPVVAFGRSARPVEFDAIDEEPCTLFFLVLGPTSQNAQEGYLKTMAKISRLMRNAEVRQALMSAASSQDLIAAIVTHES